MDLGAYSNIEKLKNILIDNNIEIQRLRGIRLMKKEKKVPLKHIEEIIKNIKLDNAIHWLRQHDWDSWSSWKDEVVRKSFIIKKVENEEGEFEKQIVGIDWSKVNRKDRNTIKLKNNEDEKRVRECFDMFNKYVGKNVLYIHARQGGGNRLHYPINTQHPMYLSDCDDFNDSTYCDIYYDLTKAKKGGKII